MPVFGMLQTYGQFRIHATLLPRSGLLELCVQADCRGSVSFQPSAASRRRLNAALDINGYTALKMEGALILAYSIVFDITELRREGRFVGKQLLCSGGFLNDITEANEMTPLASLVWEDYDETRKDLDHGEWYDSYVGSVYFKSLAERIKNLAASPDHATTIEVLNDFASSLEKAHLIGARWRLAIDRQPHV
jgi:hypothetical protein